jgi:hypothetical protein
MTAPPIPRWDIAYKPSLGGDEKTLTIPAESMVTALKEAQMKLADLPGGPFRIVMIAVAVDEPAAEPVAESPTP